MHQTIFKALIVGLFLSVCPALLAQCGNATTTQDPTAIATLNQALKALGGQPAIAAIQDATLTGQSQPNDASQPAEPFVWKSMGLSTRFEYSMSDGVHVSVMSQGVGQRQEPTGEITNINHRASVTILPYYLPGTIFLSLLNAPNASVTSVQASGDSDGLLHVCIMKQITPSIYSLLTVQRWDFNPATGLPVRVSFYLPDTKNQHNDGIATITFKSWQVVSQVVIPQVIQLSYDDDPQETITINSATFNQGLSPTTFQLQ